MDSAALIIQSHYRGFLTRKRNNQIDLHFASIVAEIEPDKLLEFWDCEALSRREPKKRPDTAQSVDADPIETKTVSGSNWHLQLDTAESTSEAETQTEQNLNFLEPEKSTQQKTQTPTVPSSEHEKEVDIPIVIVEDIPPSVVTPDSPNCATLPNTVQNIIIPTETIETSATYKPEIPTDKPKGPSPTRLLPSRSENRKSSIPSAASELGIRTSPDKSIGEVLSEAGFSAKSLSKEQLVEKRNQLLIDLWSYQSVIDQRHQFKLNLEQK
jgi:hypothetical protein